MLNLIDELKNNGFVEVKSTTSYSATDIPVSTEVMKKMEKRINTKNYITEKQFEYSFNGRYVLSVNITNNIVSFYFMDDLTIEDVQFVIVDEFGEGDIVLSDDFTFMCKDMSLMKYIKDVLPTDFYREFVINRVNEHKYSQI